MSASAAPSAGRSAGGPRAMRARARWVATVAPGWASIERGVLQLVARQPDLTLQEIRGALAASCGITVGLSTVHRFLGAHNLTRKKRPYTRPSRACPGAGRGPPG